MKKKFIILIIIVLLIGGIFIFTVSFQRLNLEEGSNIQLKYKYEEKDILINLTEEEEKIIINIFNGKLLGNDNPSCGFTENVSLKIGDRTICIANDTCPIYKDTITGKYFGISDSNRLKIDNILKKYGATFPCL